MKRSAEILDGLQTQIVGQEIEIYDQLSSTNDLALQRGIEGGREGTLILAEHQTGGRGRQGRRWHAPPGSSILASLILRHRLLANQIGLPNLIGALAIAAAIRELTNLPAQIKWPNDVLIHDKKVSGVLTELEYDQDHQPFFVMGFGVNVNTLPADFPNELWASATSLRIEAGREISRVLLIQAILSQIEKNYLCLKCGKIASIIAEANRLLYIQGKWIQIETPAGIFDGVVEKIDLDGGILLQNVSGDRRKLWVGEVIHTRSENQAIGNSNKMMYGKSKRREMNHHVSRSTSRKRGENNV
ncbi:MAG: biotin--[acetyl-CoA-carboxylase] ligase [Candidatus Poribacteria bacterium]|nr:biotin--[acetyl-CoA-carboxylase] ligase [Candidatus Poribacteria bacterium]